MPARLHRTARCASDVVSDVRKRADGSVDVVRRVRMDDDDDDDECDGGTARRRPTDSSSGRTVGIGIDEF